MANELHASGFAVSPGAPVVFKQKACIVRRVLSTDRVIIEDIDTGRSEVAFINQLSSITTLVPEHEAGATGEMVAGPSALPPALLAFTAAEIAKAEKRLDVIAPLLAMRKRSRKDVEDHARQSGVSAVTLYKWIKNYNGCGSLVGLMDGKRGAPSVKKLDERVEQFIQEAIDQLYLSSQQLTPRDIYQTVKDRCELERKPVPHENTVRNRIAALPLNRVRRKRGQVALADKDMPTPGVFPEPVNPLNPVQIDHVQLDMIVVFSDTRMPWGRPWLTLVIDCLTRVIIGFYLSMDRPSAVAAGMALAMGMLPKQDYLASLGLPGRWPVHGKIRKVLCDNAKEFRGEALKFGCKENAIDLELRPVKQPRYGAYIERLVGNVNMMLRKKPGTTFSNPQQRGTYDSKKKSAYTLHELEIEIADWVVNHYHVHKHGALMKPPLIVWEEKILGTDGAMAAGLPIQIADPEKLKLDFLPLESRVVSPSGVRMNKADYYHEALNRWINASDPDHPSEKRKFTVKYHPRRRREVWFLDPEVKQYVKLDRYPFQAPGDDEVDGYVGVEEHIAIEARRQHEGSQLEDKKAKAGYRLRSAHREANAVADTKRVRRKPPSSSPRSGGADRSVVETQMQPAREPVGSGANPFEAFLSKKITASMRSVTMNQFPHLHEATAQMLEASLPEKLEFVRSNHLFGYPAYDHILRDLQDLVAFPRSLKPECRAVIADSDNGKTTLTRQFIANNPIVLDEAGYPITKVLWVETPASADERRLYSAILSALNVTHRPDAPPARLEALAHEELAVQRTSVLVLDELHAMLNSPARQQKQFMASLKRLSNMRQLSIVACGTVDVSRALAIDTQFVSRFTRLALPRWQADESFLKLLASFERLMPLARPSNLTAPKMALEVFKSCDGTIGSVRKITLQAVERVLKDGGERVTFEILQGACQSFTRSRLVTAPRPS